ncbi:ribonuclease H1 isoform X1 [Oncorhynchus mykiss]|uniref:Ribonuclease H1 n=1 Tax=Oncorhynchus mykiss TaxID=8022 RepID=A0A8K9X911_ONCMY|nr:ribonuclease H1 isoform X1 [Oncorhynchus mykiss]
MFRLTGLYSIVRRAVCNGTEDIVKGTFFYAVRKGFKPGVYKTWDECKSQVDKFPYASYKRFAAEKDAWAFVRSLATSITPDLSEGASYEATLPRRAPEALEYIPIGQKRHYDHIDEEEVSPAKQSQYSSPSSKSSDGFTYIGTDILIVLLMLQIEMVTVNVIGVNKGGGNKVLSFPPGDAVVVYTDGCCSGNGKAGARAGIGVYWGRDHPLNVAEPLDGRQTNQRAELQAACKALEQAKEMNIKKLVLYTDSKFTINGVTSWVKNWKLNNWRLNSGGPVINKEHFEKLDKLNEELEVVWLHIPGHAGYPGNEEADRLSRAGAAKHLD